MASKLIAIIAGVGAGTGGSVAKRFAAAYPVVLLARNPDNYESLVKEINGAGGKAIGVSADVADASSLKKAFGQIENEFGNDYGIAVCLRVSRYFVFFI
jgi:NADP-dependent 3-hydroxy acid dehydrogenase YdfG